MDNSDNVLGRYISELYRLGSSFIGKEISKFNIGYGQLGFLMSLYSGECVCQEGLAETLCIDKGTTARSIKKLEEEGYITRERDASDRRFYKIVLTDKAKKIEPEIRKILKEWNSKLTSNLTEEEVIEVLNLMGKISKNQRKCVGKEK